MTLKRGDTDETFLSMLLSSNLLFLCFLISKSIGGKHLSIHWKSVILKLSLILSIVPLAFFVDLLKLRLKTLIGPINNSNLVLSGQDKILILSPEGFDMTLPLKSEILVITLWGFIGLCIFILRILHYYVQRRRITQSMHLSDSREIDEVLQRCIKRLDLKCNVALYINVVRASPFTTGIWKPIIVIPAKFNPPELELILLHELCHIKSRDNIYGFLRLFTLSLYWFNPLIYMMDYHIEKTAELCCDAKVVALNMKMDKSYYCHLIVDMAGFNNKNKTYEYSFSRHGKDIEERVRNIMKTNKTNKRGKVCSVILAGCMVLCSSIPVLAYQAPQTMEIQRKNHTPVGINSSFIVEFQTDSKSPIVDKIVFDRQFTDINGHIYNADKLNDDERFGCKEHTYVDGTYSVHDLHDDGSCTKEYYYAERCTKCGSITVGDLYKTVNYVKCSH